MFQEVPSIVKVVLPVPFHLYLIWSLTIPGLLTILPPRPFRKYVSIPILFFILYKSQTYPISDSSTIATLLNGCLIILFLYTFDLFVITEYPELKNYRLGKETQEDVINYKGFQKFQWCFQRACFNIRGVGWNYQVKGIPTHKSKRSKLSFILYSVFIDLGLIRVLFEVCLACYFQSNYIKQGGWNSKDPENIPLDLYGNSGMPLYKQMILATCTAFMVYTGINTLYVVGSLFWVITGLAEVEECPPAFGSMNGEFTVKSLWRNLWHKLMYQMTVPLAKFTCFGRSQSSTNSVSAISQLIFYLLVFIMTGAVHAHATSCLPWKAITPACPIEHPIYNTNKPSFVPVSITFPFLDYTVWTGRWFYSFILFPYQLLLIVVESLIIKIWKDRVGITLNYYVSMVVGLTWICLSEFIMGQRYVDEMVKGGLTFTELRVDSPLSHWFNKYGIEF